MDSGHTFMTQSLSHLLMRLMAKSFKTIVVVMVCPLPFLSCALALEPTDSLLRQSPALEIAVIDLDYVIHNAIATQTIQKIADAERDLLQKEVETDESMLREEQAALTEMVNRNDPEARDKKQAFENKLTDVRNKISERSRILSDAFGKARDVVLKKIHAVVQRISKERSLSLVMSSSVVVYQRGFDITNDVLTIVNKELPSVDIKFPEVSS